ncbi:hypothetical protein BGW38_001890 [Lunasporangiospora selenospora]|uniref:Uncharacterized protein n=1 Tax=Lunasporangiospora selenospora TaxID=979761 RepID=A0A9P6FSU4_9FUNG|nr:hypothetical protein BGW38_001890 [Lunasporangiospora selenospora]
MSTKKQRRFSLVRLFSSPKCSSLESVPPTPAIPARYRRSTAMIPEDETASTHSTDSTSSQETVTGSTNSATSMRSEMLRERRKSIATLTSEHSLPFRSMSLDLRRPSILQHHSHSGKPGSRPKQPVVMNEKMKQFDELLQTRRSGTIRISLTPTLVQEPF